MHECCQAQYDGLFDLERAKEDLADYLADGPKKSSKHLINVLKNLDIKGFTLLDIGGGIGAITHELTDRGVEGVQHMDISNAYATIFEEEIKRRGIDNVSIMRGDFKENHTQISAADIVTLDKVICCYDDYVELVTQSVKKSTKYYGCVLPKDAWWVKLIFYFDNLSRIIRKRNFRSFVHPVRKVEGLITDQGFRRIAKVKHGNWLTLLYEK